MSDELKRAIERDAAQGDYEAAQRLKRQLLRECGTQEERLVVLLGEQVFRDDPVAGLIYNLVRHQGITAEEALAAATGLLLKEREDLVDTITRLRQEQMPRMGFSGFNMRIAQDPHMVIKLDDAS